MVDYKLEFGLAGAELALGDEFTPDSCRLWDRETRTKLDKDRFRHDLGDVVESYEIAGRRLGGSRSDVRSRRAGRQRRGVGAAEQGGLENRCARQGTEGSNTSLSAS